MTGNTSSIGSRRGFMAIGIAVVAWITSLHANAQAPASVPVKIYAQELVDRTVLQHPDLRAVVLHVTPVGASTNIVIASSIGRIGKAADADDLDVVATGKTRVSMDRGNKRIEVELALHDVGGQTVGALGLVWRYPVGGNHKEFERIATLIRDTLARRILNVANLMDPSRSSPQSRPSRGRRPSWTRLFCATPRSRCWLCVRAIQQRTNW